MDAPCPKPLAGSVHDTRPVGLIREGYSGKWDGPSSEKVFNLASEKWETQHNAEVTKRRFSEDAKKRCLKGNFI
jgi:hypothetical protein